MVLIYQFRYYIMQLCAQVEIEHTKMKNFDGCTLYRGQRMMKEELEKLRKNVGSLVSTNGFLSSSYDQAVADAFTSHIPSDDEFCGIIFEIKIDSCLSKNVIFAPIGSLSDFADESEVLFCLGTIFKIISVEFNFDSSVWLVKLYPSDEDSHRIHEFCNEVNEVLQEISPISYFGYVLANKLEQFDRAIAYFKMLLKKLPNDHPELAHIYQFLGHIYRQKPGDTRLANCYWEKYFGFRDTKNITTSVDNEDITDTIEGLQDQNTSPKEKAIALSICGELSENYDEKLMWYSRALDILNECIPISYENIVDCLDGIARIHKFKGEYRLAITYYQRKLKMEEKYMLPESSNILEDIENIVEIYKSIDEQKNAWEFCKEKVNELVKNYGKDHATVAKLCKFMKSFMQKTKEIERQQQEYIEQLNTCSADDLEMRSQLLWMLGFLYACNGYYSKSIEYKLQEIEFRKNDIQYALIDIAQCYFNMHEYDRALDYIKKALAAFPSDPEPNPMALEQCQDMIRKIEKIESTHNINILWSSNLEDNQ